VTYADCHEIVAACKTAGVILAVCHVLRYLPQARKITQLIRSGCIGDVVNIQHTEPVSSYAGTELKPNHHFGFAMSNAPSPQCAQSIAISMSICLSVCMYV